MSNCQLRNIYQLRHLIGICCWWGLALPAFAEPPEKGLDFFEQKIRPVLADHCYKCHSTQSEKLKGGLLLDFRDGLLKGGEGGPVIDLAHPEKSRLLEAVNYQNPDLQMPPKEKLAAAQIADLATWIKMGAPDPRTNSHAAGTNSATAEKPAYDYQEARQWWAFQPVKTSPPPKVKNVAWVRSPIDNFILAKLESKKLTPASPADKPTLLRRATFDLTGLPPTPEETKAFLADTSPNAFAKVVDRLLASPAYGQRWARHWLDVVRYADARDLIQLPAESDFREIWRYRDWVVTAFNQDMPYDQFVTYQIAGDLIQPRSPKKINKDAVIATGLLALADFVPGDNDKEQMIADYVNDEIDVVGRCFLGLTLACARCHDHKFDPISTEDYYGLAGIFFSTRVIPSPVPGNTPLVRIPLLPKAELESIESAKRRVKELKRLVNSSTDRAYRDNLGNLVIDQTARYLKATWDYTHTATNSTPAALEEFAKQNKLESQFLSQWLDYLGVRNYQLLSTFHPDAEGLPAVGVWSGKTPRPAIVFNGSDAPVNWKTHSLPSHAVAFCPSKTNGVVIGWKSPFTGTVSLTGRIKYPALTKGLGIAMALELKVPGGRSELASATVPNGGDQALETFSGAGRLRAISVQAGDVIEMSATSRGDAQGLALVEWTISEEGGDRVWDLAQDLSQQSEKGAPNNPRPDAYGHAGTWQLLDPGGAKPTPGEPGRLNPALAAWRESARAAEAGRADHSAIEKSAAEIEQTLRMAKMQAEAAAALLSPTQKLLTRAEIIKLQARDNQVSTGGDDHVIQWINRAGNAMENAAPVPKVPSPAKASAIIQGKSRPVLRFTGKEMLQVAEKAPPQGSLFLVYKVAENSPSGQRLVGWEDADVGRYGLGLMMGPQGELHAIVRKDGASGDIVSSEKTAAEFEILSITWGPQGTTLHRNQKSLGANTQIDSLTSDPAIESLKIGGPGSGSSPKFQGDLAELRVYDEQLDDAARQLVENELTATWFVPESKEEEPPASPAEALFNELASAQGPYRLNEADKTKWLPAETVAGLERHKKELETVNKTIATDIPIAVAVEDGGPKETKHAGFHDSPIFLRGNPKNLGRVVPRGFPRVLAGDAQKPITQGSGRLELAKWIANRDNPLTARILVNRIWQHHFGEGIVRTPNNFGKRGESPTHPELLDYLANRFIESGWSIKELHRAIMLSSVYQESSHASAKLLSADPENNLFGRMNRRPLDAEAMRDSLLAVAGRLDLKAGGAGFQGLDEPRRTLYLMSVRTGVTNGFTPLFDRPDGTTIIEKRNTSTVAPQALFLLNDPFMMAQASALVDRIKQNNPQGSETARIQNLYELTLGRAPSREELKLGLAFLAQKQIKDPWNRYCQIILCSTEFATVD